MHLVRSSLRYASKADWSKITAELKGVYTAATVGAAEARFAEFAGTWRDKYPAMIAMWERSWPEFVPFLDFPLPVRRLIYTTDEIVKSGPAAQAGPASSFLRSPQLPETATAAAVKVERPVGATTLTAARTAVTSGSVGAGDRRAKSSPLGLEGLPRC